ncbi:MAG: redoxin protein [Chthonomonadales bacterium]|nr:redoxin protein [Chthonomonadales bacterium]
MRIRKTGCRIAAWMMTVVVLLLHGSLMARAQGQAPTDPTEFLKWSMAHYAALTNFQADCYWSESFGLGGKMIGKRRLVLANPNRYKVVFQTVPSGIGLGMTAVCDGKLAVEYSDFNGQVALKSPVPTTIAGAKAQMMQNPMVGASLLYHFFEGPERLAELANTTQQEITFGRDATVDGHVCKTVNFYATGDYGKTSVAIGVEDGWVYRIRYDSASLRAKEAEGGNQEGRIKPSSEAEEDYVHIVTNAVLPASAFDTTLPRGMKLRDPAAKEVDEDEPKPRPPVPLGKIAPNFTVRTLTGKKRSLKDFRGKVVMIDFWATWCFPCRLGLPETQKLAKAYQSKGLAVLAISDEDAKTVSPFLRSNHYTFPTYLDAEDKAATTYNIDGIPTVVVIDKRGRLVNYLVGLQDPATIQAALKKAGLNLSRSRRKQ